MPSPSDAMMRTKLYQARSRLLMKKDSLGFGHRQINLAGWTPGKETVPRGPRYAAPDKHLTSVTLPADATTLYHSARPAPPCYKNPAREIPNASAMKKESKWYYRLRTTHLPACPTGTQQDVRREPPRAGLWRGPTWYRTCRLRVKRAGCVV